MSAGIGQHTNNVIPTRSHVVSDSNILELILRVDIAIEMDEVFLLCLTS